MQKSHASDFRRFAKFAGRCSRICFGSLLGRVLIAGAVLLALGSFLGNSALSSL